MKRSADFKKIAADAREVSCGDSSIDDDSHGAARQWGKDVHASGLDNDIAKDYWCADPIAKFGIMSDGSCDPTSSEDWLRLYMCAMAKFSIWLGGCYTNK